ncbi:MAG: hypothetical protein II779_00415, partial [Clostridia bacterium]|nr:hypothetical protein [Clostridia bacterium]
ETGAAAEETEADRIDVLSKSFTRELQSELGLDGYETNILLRLEGYEWSNPDIVAEETTGERLNDAVFNRNEWLAETYGFTIKAGYSSGDATELKTLAAAGDDAYDIAFPQARAGASMAQSGILTDLSSVAYLDFGNPAWSRMFTDMLKIGGKLYYAAGDISVNSYQAVISLLFNKQMAVDYHLDDPYTLVREGGWTMDRFDAMCSATAEDLNGDGSMTADDQWGLILQTSKGGIVMYYGCGEHLAALNEEEEPYWSVGRERSVDVYNRVRTLLYERGSCYECADYDTLSLFSEGRSLFLQAALFHVDTLRQSETDFGILPMPKYDADQEEYVQSADGWCISPLVIPSIVGNKDRAGLIAEALAEASSVKVKPEYYEIILKGKLTRDEESAEMLDIIYTNFVVDPADLYQWGNFENEMIAAMRGGKELPSLLASKSKGLTKLMEKTMDAFAKLSGNE